MTASTSTGQDVNPFRGLKKATIHMVAVAAYAPFRLLAFAIKNNVLN
ncbi:hypothetical protein PSEG_01945 [Pseudomonas sp. Nvir]|jgi:hypothetical protein|nr:hypothetical protein [Pseudomonas juntendi]CAH0648130.1 hypothetical protein PSNVIR_02388 [Pseudomonas sp. Nvir]